MDQQEGQPPGHPRKHSWSEEDQEDGTPGPPRPSDQRDERSAEAGKADERRPTLRLRTSQSPEIFRTMGSNPIDVRNKAEANHKLHAHERVINLLENVLMF